MPLLYHFRLHSNLGKHRCSRAIQKCHNGAGRCPFTNPFVSRMHRIGSSTSGMPTFWNRIRLWTGSFGWMCLLLLSTFNQEAPPPPRRTQFSNKSFFCRLCSISRKTHCVRQSLSRHIPQSWTKPIRYKQKSTKQRTHHRCSGNAITIVQRNSDWRSSNVAKLLVVVLLEQSTNTL